MLSLFWLTWMADRARLRAPPFNAGMLSVSMGLLIPLAARVSMPKR